MLSLCTSSTEDYGYVYLFYLFFDDMSFPLGLRKMIDQIKASKFLIRNVTYAYFQHKVNNMALT